MFFPHRATILTQRSEPAQFDQRRAEDLVRRRNAAVAERVVLRDLLVPKKLTRQTQRRLTRAQEVAVGREDVQEFLKIWSRWREFYFGLSPITVKTKGQLTVIEQILVMVAEQNLDLRMLIAVVHKAFIWRKKNPGFDEVIKNGVAYLERYQDDVLADIDKAAYEKAVIKRGI